jgi:hypothetical protein
MKLKTVIIFLGLFTMACGLMGCDAFVHKFTRKSKKAEVPRQELVLVPEEYKPPKMTKEEVYRHYFLYWQSWHEELINALTAGLSQKKRLDCTDEAIKNLEELKKIMQGSKQKRMDIYLEQMRGLRESLASDLYGDNLQTDRLTAERLKRGIMREFSYDKVKDYLA